MNPHQPTTPDGAQPLYQPTLGEVLASADKRATVIDICKLYIQRVILDGLNGAIAADAAAMRNLVELRVSCNDAMADADHIQVQSAVPGRRTAVPLVGMIGVLNGVLDRMVPGHRLMAHYDADGRLLKFAIVHWEAYLAEAAKRLPTEDREDA